LTVSYLSFWYFVRSITAFNLKLSHGTLLNNDRENKTNSSPERDFAYLF
jgi:hypothetical protein